MNIDNQIRQLEKMVECCRGAAPPSGCNPVNMSAASRPYDFRSFHYGAARERGLAPQAGDTGCIPTAAPRPYDFRSFHYGAVRERGLAPQAGDTGCIPTAAPRPHSIPSFHLITDTGYQWSLKHEKST